MLAGNELYITAAIGFKERGDRLADSFFGRLRSAAAAKLLPPSQSGPDCACTEVPVLEGGGAPADPIAQ